jgi:hypothetical protein
MNQIKPITPAGIPAALQKAHRYRLLNDSTAAESICLDILALDPDNVEARVTHVLALTDQFAAGSADILTRAREAVARLADPYRNAYYNGIISERWARGILQRGAPHAAVMAHESLARAMDWYTKAEALRPQGNDDAILRWNTCVRLMERHPEVRPGEPEPFEPSFE